MHFCFKISAFLQHRLLDYNFTNVTWVYLVQTSRQIATYELLLCIMAYQIVTIILFNLYHKMSVSYVVQNIWHLVKLLLFYNCTVIPMQWSYVQFKTNINRHTYMKYQIMTGMIIFL